MAATDTLIGIAGAAVLVAVMVGVFVYEYNNVPDGDPGPDPTARLVYQNYTGSGTALAGQNLGSHTYTLAANATHLHIEFSATSPAGMPSLSLQVALPDGTTQSVSANGQLMLDAPTAGQYTFTVTADTVALQASYDIRLVGEF